MIPKLLTTYQNPNLSSNIRDYANIHQLIVLVNLESMNAELIKQEIAKNDRLAYLNKMAIEQMKSLVDSVAVQRLDGMLNQPNLMLTKENDNEK